VCEAGRNRLSACGWRSVADFRARKGFGDLAGRGGGAGEKRQNNCGRGRCPGGTNKSTSLPPPGLSDNLAGQGPSQSARRNKRWAVPVALVIVVLVCARPGSWAATAWGPSSACTEDFFVQLQQHGSPFRED